MDAELIESLLRKNEGSDKDAKQEQYRFTGADDKTKAELVKDILAFANAWKTDDAHILIGVEEVKGGRDKACGVTHHLEDANVQQLVNKKTNTAAKFIYLAEKIDGEKVGIIKINRDQKRPIYLRKDFGKLRKDVVYMRQESSTVEASLDENRLDRSTMDSCQAKRCHGDII